MFLMFSSKNDFRKMCLFFFPFLFFFSILHRNSPAERTIPEIDISGIDPKLHSALMPFQRQSVYFGVHLDGRILIADDMGLGKTLQALALAHYYLNDWPLLIVTPSSMKYSWEEAVRQWLPSVPLHHIQVSVLVIHSLTLIFIIYLYRFLVQAKTI